jgi:thiamine biosynthesis lipoprotein
MAGPGRWAAVLAGLGAAAAPAAAPAETGAWRLHADGVLGTSMDLVAVAPDRATALAAAAAVQAEVARLDRVLSGWRGDSELSALNAAARFEASADLFAVIAACERWRGLTGGAFDARQGLAFEPLRAGAAPDAALRRAAAEAEVGLDPATRAIWRPEPVRFAPEALAKGHVIDAALAAARIAAPALQGLMLDIGGDLACWGASPGGKGWLVGVADPARPEDNGVPLALVRADGRALATSGPALRGAHLLGAEASNQASVVAGTAVDADALATALAVMAPSDGVALAERLPGVEAQVVDPTGGLWRTAGWSPVSAPPLVRTAAAAAAPWPDRFAVTIDYQLPSHGTRAYAPYVVIWITDDANRLVRAVTMLGNDLDYVGENYIWWRRYGRARPQLVAAVSRPTRPPGRYSAVWDGRDDMGRPVGQGRYTVHVEVVRENGGHSYQSVDLALGAAPAQAALPADADGELGPVSVRYGRR